MTHKRLLVAIVLLAASGVLAQTKSTGDTVSSTLAIQPSPSQPMVMIGGDSRIIEVRDKSDKLMVLVSPDGKVTYGSDYLPDASARTFWEALAKDYPIVCKAKEKP